MKHWDHDEARGLKAQGMGFAEIGSIFGVSYYSARSKLDPVWLEKRRAQINANRDTASLGKRDHVHHIKPEPTKPAAIDSGPFGSASGLKAYYEPHRRILQWGLSHRVVATRVALPFITMQHRAALDKGREEP